MTLVSKMTNKNCQLFGRPEGIISEASNIGKWMYSDLKTACLIEIEALTEWRALN